MQWLPKGGIYSGNEKMVEIKRKIANGPRIMRLLATSIDVAINLSATNTDRHTERGVTTNTKEKYQNIRSQNSSVTKVTIF